MSRYKKRKDGRYETTVTVKDEYHKDGSPVKRHLYAKSARELDSKVRAALNQIESGDYKTDTGVIVRDYALQWFDVYKSRKSINTQRMYLSAINSYIIPAIGAIQVSKLKEAHVQKMINASWDHPRTAIIINQTAHQIVKKAIKDHLLRDDICLGVDLPKYKAQERRALTESERIAVRSAEFRPEDKALVYLLYGCGLRRGEALALRKRHITKDGVNVHDVIVFDSNRPVLKEQPKTDGSFRTVPIPDSLRPDIIAYIEDKAPDDFLFCLSDGSPISEQAYKRRWERIKKTMHAPDITAHIFRHNYATMLYYSGLSIKKAAALMGHSDINMIMKIYSHLDEQKENAAEKISAIFS